MNGLLIIGVSCSFLKFIIRAFAQFVFLTPKPPLFPTHPADRPFIGSILASNLICIVLHALWAPPSAGEATRGYLHGGLVMDFIGQKASTSRLYLLLLDVLVVVLQLVQMSVHITRQRLKEGGAATTTTSGQQPAAPASRQDLDSEERGVRRSEEGIEMQNLDPTGAAHSPTNNEDDDRTERDTLLSTTTLRPHSDAAILDTFNSGQIVLGDFDIAKTIREQIIAYKTTPREVPRLDRNVRANITGQLLRWRFGATVGRPATAG